MKTPSDTTVRGEGGVAGKGKLVGVPKFPSCTTHKHLLSIYSINFAIVAHAQNCLDPINQNIYCYAKMQARKPLPCFNNQYFDTCSELTTHVFGIDLFSSISPSNCIQVYKYVFNNVRSRL